MLIYSASKAAQVNMVKSLAPQFAPHGVTINNLAPGAIETGRNAEILSNQEYRNDLEKRIPAGRIGIPEDCMGIAALLCSDAGSYITGQDLLVDGGLGLCT
jgi:NAD(P)-dependent dehydrogenase (short-subunit alcohol dehydrogenase family)